MTNIVTYPETVTYFLPVPDMRCIYPEYLSDPKILLCPSDPEIPHPSSPIDALEFKPGIKRIQTLMDNGLATQYCMLAHLTVPRSYAYFSFATFSAAQGRAMLYLWGEQGLADPQPIALEVGEECPYVDEAKGQILAEVHRPMTALDARDFRDTYALVEANNKPLPWALHPLHEGIERIFFLQGDPHPESEIPVMFDFWGSPSSTASVIDREASIGMNHVPNGCNVLYMDGHVRFVKYDIQYPVMNDPKGYYGGDFGADLASLNLG